MAELVQLHIENSIPELEQMERIGLFTRQEIKKIVKRRRACEYTLRRQKKRKEDYLKYIQYELNLLSLIGKRRQRLQCDLKRKEIDFAIATRINKLFKTVVLKYQSDVSLWLSQIDFCKRMNWNDSISGLFNRMLQVHSTNDALWASAAKWEIEENNAPENARQLLQRALRHHPKSHHLWLEYFRMELMYTDIVLKRREVLGIQGVKENCLEEPDAVLDGSIAMVVYKNAVSAISDVAFALSFIPICQEFEFTEKHIEQIFEDIISKHPNEEEALDATARRPFIGLKQVIRYAEQRGEKKKHVIQNVSEEVCKAYEEAIVKLPTNKMWRYYIEFLMQQLKMTKKEKRKHKLRLEIVNLMHRAASADCLEYGYYMEWIRLLVLCNKDDKALDASLTATRKWPSKVSVWLTCISLHIENKKDREEISALFNDALAAINEKESFPLWQLGVQWVSLCKPGKLVEFLEKGIRGCKEVSLPMMELYLEASALQGDIDTVRNLYKRLTRMSSLAVGLHRKMIQIEKAQLKQNIEWLRKYYEEAIRYSGNCDVDLWCDYIKLEMEHPDGDPQLYNMLHWRAIKCLDDKYTDEFVTRITLYRTGKGLASKDQE